jgi:hypothetical protein
MFLKSNGIDGLIFFVENNMCDLNPYLNHQIKTYTYLSLKFLFDILFR